jgi:hypothetical protein
MILFATPFYVEYFDDGSPGVLVLFIVFANSCVHGICLVLVSGTIVCCQFQIWCQNIRNLLQFLFHA